MYFLKIRKLGPLCSVKSHGEEEEKECGEKISSFTGGKSHSPTRASNLKRHLNRKHKEIYEKVVQRDEQALKAKQGAKEASRSSTKKKIKV